jgi:hypothetical protein
MTIAIWGTLAAIFALFVATALTLIETAEPAGRHHRPSRRQLERATDEETVGTFRDIHAGQYLDEAAERAMWGVHYGQPGEPGWEGTAEDYAAAMAAGPLMPLPPEVVRDVLAQVCPQCGEHYGNDTDYECGCFAHAVWPEDPHDVATPEDEADQFVGDLGPAELEETSQPPGGESSGTLEETSKPPEFEHLRAGQYEEATGQFSRAVLDAYEQHQAVTR